MSMLRNLKQTCTYWAPTGSDAYGKKTWAAPVPLPCRWEDAMIAFQDRTGRELVSSARVITMVETDDEGYMFLGVSTAPDPTLVKGAQPIKTSRMQPDLRSLAKIYSALLG